MAGVERYGPGRDAGNLVPGDFILAHRHHPLAILISQAERRRFKGPHATHGEQFRPEARQRAVAYALAQVGQPFGYLDLASAGLHLLFGWPLRVVRRNHEICSSLVVKSLQQGGLVPDLDPALALPADLAKEFDVRP